MVSVAQSIAWYDNHAAAVAAEYESLTSADLYTWLDGFIPHAAGLVLDVGAGTGRDAAWLSSLGHSVFAVEPSIAMRAEAERRHPENGVIWLSDELPALPATHRLGLSFNLILVSGVWQHIASGDRERAMRKLLGLLRPGGVLVMTLRHGSVEPERKMYPVSLVEVEYLARRHGAVVARVAEMPDQLGRLGVSWTGLVLQLPDDGTGALPLLRHVILNDRKTATYKLGLLRALCRAADGQGGMANERDGGDIELPLGIVALNWLRLYLPLIQAGLPQARGDSGGERLGFIGPGFRALLSGEISRLDLRVGASFSGNLALAVRAALQESSDLISKMPASYMTFPNGGPILPTTRRLAPRPRDTVIINAEFLSGFGQLKVPGDLWRALCRFAAWVEPALIAEWQKLMRDYAARLGRKLDEAVLSETMTWTDPSRETILPRERAFRLLQSGDELHCVWSGQRLSAATIDIDHCLPWAAWPCGDLWNLLPTHARVNRHQKRDRIPSDELLRRAATPIQAWWRRAYIDEGPLLLDRFLNEAKASLPALVGTELPTTGEIFAALRAQRVRLKNDQQVVEWLG